MTGTMARERSGRTRPERGKPRPEEHTATRREIDAAARRAIQTNREALTELAKW